MTSQPLAEPRPGLADNLPGSCESAWCFIEKSLAVVSMDLRKLRRDPSELLTRAIQPALWLMVFGQVFTHAQAIPTGDLPYQDFMAPGILAQSVLFIAIFYGIAVIWERDLGIVHKLLVTPTPRTALVLGKGLSAGVRALSQALIIYILSWSLGVHLNHHPLAIIGVLVVVVIGADLFSTFSLIIACWVKTRERFMGIGQVLTMPLFFASNAIYPIAMMPPWLKVVAWVNPLTYEVDALRTLMLANSQSDFGLMTDFSVLIVTTLVLTLFGASLYPRLAT